MAAGRDIDPNLKLSHQEIENVKASLQSGLYALSNLKNEDNLARLSEKIANVTQNIREIAKTLDMIRYGVNEILKNIPLPDTRTEKLVKWFRLTPTVTQRFSATMNYMRDTPEGEFVPLDLLTQKLVLSAADSNKEKSKDTERILRSIVDLRMLECLRMPGAEPSYALSAEARGLIKEGVFASLGVAPV